MNVLELFCGTKSFTKIAKSRGHSCLTLDIDAQFNPDICMDILDLEPEKLDDFHPDIIWASPPCNCFSQDAISHHWVKTDSGEYLALSENAQVARDIFVYTNWLIKTVSPKWYFIENPVSSLRKREFMQEHPFRRTVTYCQYGDSRMKPTDIWTNFENWIPRPMCKQRNLCHDSAPRGSKTGTQGIKNRIERAIVPDTLCKEILIACENVF